MGPLRPESVASVQAFSRCGNLASGFTRLACTGCGHQHLLAFACKARHLCPACHQRRVLQSARWIAHHVCLPDHCLSELTELFRHHFLHTLLRRKSVMYGDFTLASGRKSDFYCDARLTTLDPLGAIALGEVGWDLVRTESARLGTQPNAIGGLTMGADPVALAIGIGAARAGADLQVFSIRKQPKSHGRGRLIEGNFKPGDTVEGRIAILSGLKAGEQVVTSGQNKLFRGVKVLTGTAP
jgi:hypothetical protein